MAEWESERGALAKSPQMCVVAGYTERASQFLRELHFIEASSTPGACSSRACRSSFGNCTSLRHHPRRHGRVHPESQFLRELHFTEAGGDRYAYRGY
mgnify:CR=1 FL=1